MNVSSLKVSLRSVLLALVVVSLSGCYHAVVDTGLTPSGEIHERPWAHSFIGGLVPPDRTSGADVCPIGVARVETQLSFLNGLVSGLTWGIYTPMTIRVACAQGEDDDQQALRSFREVTESYRGSR